MKLHLKEILLFSDFTPEAALAAPYALRLAKELNVPIDICQLLPIIAEGNERLQTELAEDYCRSHVFSKLPMIVNAMNQPRVPGFVSIPSTHSVDEIVARLTGMLGAKGVKGVKLFAIVDHSGEAAAAGLTMPPTRLLIFGNPKAGTPLMLSRPSVAIDLPLKLLLAEAEGGGCTISYNSPAYLRERHALPEELMPAIAVIEELAVKAAE